MAHPSVEHLTHLISIKSVTRDTAAATAIYDYVVSQLADVPVYITREEYDGFPSLIVTTRETKAPKLWLSAHVDVVPAPEQLFTPREEAGKLYGRGAYDMKFAVAYYLTLLQELGEQCPEYDLGLMLTADEEIGGFAGTGALLSRGGYGGEIAFVPDGGGPFRPMRHAKGMYMVKVIVSGVAAHSSRPWLGHSATGDLVRFLSAVQSELDALIAHDDPEHWHPTYNIGLIGGGQAPNQVADHAEATIDIRYPDQDSKCMIRDKLVKIAAQYPQVALEVLFDESDHGVAPEDPHLAPYFAALRIECGQTEPEWDRAHGTSDARFFFAAGCRIVIDRPAGGDIHADGEWLDLESFHTHYRVLRRYVDAVARLDAPTDARTAN